MPTDAEIRTALETYVDCWRTNDRERWLQLFSSDAEFIDPVGTPAHEGKDAVAAFWDRVHTMPMEMKPEVDRIVACGGEGVLVFRMKAVAANGMGMEVSVVDLFQFNDAGEVTQLKAYWDSKCQRGIRP
jgi:steroid delta-isomerase